jgi:hypothetical protein
MDAHHMGKLEIYSKHYCMMQDDVHPLRTSNMFKIKLLNSLQKNVVFSCKKLWLMTIAFCISRPLVITLEDDEKQCLNESLQEHEDQCWAGTKPWFRIDLVLNRLSVKEPIEDYLG